MDSGFLFSTPISDQLENLGEINLPVFSHLLNKVDFLLPHLVTCW